MTRRRIIYFIMAIMALLLAFNMYPTKTLKVGMHPWPGYETLLLAEHFAWLPVQSSVIESENASQTIKLLTSGEIQVAALTLDEAMQVARNGLNISIVAIMNESVGADVVLSRSRVDSFSSLKGKTIALEGSSVSNIVLDQYLHAAGLQDEDVSLVYLPPNDQVRLWEDSKFDAAISFEPYATYLENKGAQRIFDSKQFPNLIFDVLVVRNDLMWLRSKQLSQLLQGHFRAIQYIRVNREDALRRIAAWRELSFDEMEMVFGGLYLPDLNYNKRMLGAHSDLFKAMLHETKSSTSGKNDMTNAVLLGMLDSAYIDRLH